MRLKKKDLSKIRDEIASIQGNKCSICLIDLNGEGCLDHDHKTGRIRSVLCRNCNGMEGKIFNLCRRGKRDKTELDYLESIQMYWVFHRDNPRAILHPNHRTDEERRIRRNKLARERRNKNKSC